MVVGEMANKGDVINTLKSYVARKRPVKSSDEVREEESEIFKRLYSEWKGSNDFDDTNYKVIPKFYFKLPKDDEFLLQKLREEARAVFLQRRSKDLLDNEELQNLWVTLDKHHTPPLFRNEQMINYEDFLKVADECPAKCKQFFKASTFAKLLNNDPYGRISVMHFFNYVMRKVWLHQTRIGLSLYDVAGLGYLRENDLENYIYELIPTLSQLDQLDKSFHSFYVCTAVRKFFFFLDPMRTGKIKIQDVLACSFLDDLLELRDDDLPKDVQESNWFSAHSALRVYGQYLNLDSDHNGMLSKEELAKYGTGTADECLPRPRFPGVPHLRWRNGLQDVPGFRPCPGKPQRAAVAPVSLPSSRRPGQRISQHIRPQLLLPAIQEQMKMHATEPVSFDDVKNEIFDMVKPADPLKLALQDLIRSGQGDTVVGILVDLNTFWAYENREVVVPNQPPDEAEV